MALKKDKSKKPCSVSFRKTLAQNVGHHSRAKPKRKESSSTKTTALNAKSRQSERHRISANLLPRSVESPIAIQITTSKMKHSKDIEPVKPSKHQPPPPPQGTISIQAFNISMKKNSKSSLSSEKNPLDTPEMMEMFEKFLKTFPKTHPAQKVELVPEPRRENSCCGVIEDREMLETINEELNELFNNANTLKTSYRDIIQSLVSLQKKHKHQSTQKSLWLLESGIDGKNKRKSQKDGELSSLAFTNNQFESEINQLAQFKDPKTRDKAFHKLFSRVDRLRAATNHFCQTFDERGYLMEDKYQKYTLHYGGCTFRDYNHWHAEIKQLSKIIGQILQEYNRELLELFHISRGSTF